MRRQRRSEGWMGVNVGTFVVGETFEHDHHVIDQQFEQFQLGLEREEWLIEPFQNAAEGLRHHIFVEEEVLFPCLRVGGLVAPVMVMLREHADIWQALGAVDAAIGNDVDGARTGMARLVSVLEQHNMKEERILYPASSQVLAEDDTEAVRAAFEDGTRPQGWLPTNLRR